MYVLTGWLFTEVPLFELEGQWEYVRVRHERIVCEKGLRAHVSSSVMQERSVPGSGRSRRIAQWTLEMTVNMPGITMSA